MTIELIRPMLAVALKPKDMASVALPTLASRKIDGIRALCRANPETGKPELVSRTLKLIPNKATQERFAHKEYIGLDGELVVGNPFDKNLMQQTTSGVMSEDGDPKANWHVFDKWDWPKEPYYSRAAQAKNLVHEWEMLNPDCGLVWVPHHVVNSLDEIYALEETWVNEGYEGMMLRHPMSPYKMNRSTLREGYLLKVKRFEDDEAVIIGVKEQETNNNEATTDERGFTKRSTHQANKTAAGMLGAVLVRGISGRWNDVEFEVGTGFTKEQRVNLWEGRNYLTGKVICYKHFPVGVKDKPRFPTFKAFRKD